MSSPRMQPPRIAYEVRTQRKCVHFFRGGELETYAHACAVERPFPAAAMDRHHVDIPIQHSSASSSR